MNSPVVLVVKMIPVREIMKRDFAKLRSLDSVGSAVEAMEKLNVDCLLIEEECEIKGMVTPHELVGYPSSRLILDCAIQRIATISEETLVDEVLEVLEEKEVTFLVVLDGEGIPVGVVDRKIIVYSLFQELEKSYKERERYITKLERTEEALEISKANFHNIVQRSADGVIIVGSDGIVRFVNPTTEHIFSRKADELLGELFGFPVIIDESTEIDIVRFGGESGIGEMRVADIEWQGKPAYLASIRDVTELVDARCEAEKASQAKSEFLANVSHELRTPLTAILGLAEVLESRLYGDLNKDQYECIRTIQNSGTHLLSLINDILDIARTGIGKLVLDIRPIHVIDVCHSSLQIIAQAAEKKNIKIVELVKSELMVRADEQRLRQILVNLFSNAVKFTPENGTVGLDVVADSEQERVCFTVWDTGIGIPEADLERVFQPFIQLDTLQQPEGTGLGLAVAMSLVELHGGDISVKSKVNEGSQFIVSLPL